MESFDGSIKVGGHYNVLMEKKECVLGDIVRKPEGSTTAFAYSRAGPRPHLHFNPKTVNAAIVTCGGLCPGLNNVIREITNSLIRLYGIEGKVYGIIGGYKGFYALEPVLSTPDILLLLFTTIIHNNMDATCRNVFRIISRRV